MKNTLFTSFLNLACKLQIKARPLLMLLLLVTSPFIALSQTVTLSSTSSQCKATGGINVNINPSPGSPQSQYTVTITGTDIYGQPYNVGPTNTLNIGAVPAGNYSVTVQDPLISFTNTQSISVAGNYQVPGPLSNQTITHQTTSCTGIVTPGSVTLNQPVNGLAPYAYALGNSPSSWQSSLTFSGLAPGTYVTNAMDVCGDIRIGSVTINNTTPALPPLLPGQLFNLPCAQDSLNIVIPTFISGTFTSLALEIRSGNCTGPVLYSLSLPLSASYFNRVPRIAGACYQMVGITGCDGGTVTRALTVPAYSFDATAVANGGASNCAGTRNYNIITENMKPGFVVTFWNSNYSSQIGSAVNYPNPSPVSGLNLNNQYILPFSWTQATGAYYAIVADACGQIDTAVINHTATTPSYAVGISGIVGPYGCETGKSSYVTVGNYGGVAPFTYVFTSVPAGALPIVKQKADPAYFYINNLIPGTYNMDWTDACGNTKPLTFTINDNQTVKFTAGKLDSVGRACGEINSNVYFSISGNFTNAEPVKLTVQLQNTLTGTLIDAANTFSYLNSFLPKAQVRFLNIPAGKYVVKFKWELFSNDPAAPAAYTLGDCFQPSYDTITVLNTTVPELSNSQAFLCSGGNGIVYATATGGFPPYQYHIKSGNVGAVYGPLQTSNSFNISGIAAGAIYNIEVIDRCNNTSNYQVAFLNSPEPREITTTPQDVCIGDFVTMSLSNPFTNAIYEWRNPANTVIGTGTSIFFPSVQLSDSGMYTLITNISGCLILNDSRRLVVRNCLQNLPVQLTSFTASRTNEDVLLKWNVASEQDMAGYEVQKSYDAINFSKLNYVKATGSSKYETIDYNENGKVFYRLKMLDVTGTFTYSNNQLINAVDKSSATRVWPIPVKNDLNISLTNDKRSSVAINILSLTGTIVVQQKVECHEGENVLTIDCSSLVPGQYVIQINNGTSVVNKRIFK